jgi:hypothetical protein
MTLRFETLGQKESAGRLKGRFKSRPTGQNEGPVHREDVMIAKSAQNTLQEAKQLIAEAQAARVQAIFALCSPGSMPLRQVLESRVRGSRTSWRCDLQDQTGCLF